MEKIFALKSTISELLQFLLFFEPIFFTIFTIRTIRANGGRSQQNLNEPISLQMGCGDGHKDLMFSKHPNFYSIYFKHSMVVV